LEQEGRTGNLALVAVWVSVLLKLAATVLGLAVTVCNASRRDG
jgi:hypothetical protein